MILRGALSMAVVFLMAISGDAARRRRHSDALDGVLEYLANFGESLFGQPDYRSGEAVSRWDPDSPFNPEELGHYAEGDILFPRGVPGTLGGGAQGRNGLRAKTSRWTDGIVPYVIRDNFNQADLHMIDYAMREYRRQTCVKKRDEDVALLVSKTRYNSPLLLQMTISEDINMKSKIRNRPPQFDVRFVPRTTERDYLVITSSNTGCWSSVGRLGGPQELNLQSPGCLTKVGTVMHEMMHAIGFLHEQNRWERDQYVIINYSNIQPGRESNFEKAQKWTTDDQGVTYDYDSVMHYSAAAFSANGRPTITPRHPIATLGQRDNLSKMDIQKIRRMYKCRKNTRRRNWFFFR